jgi:transcription-repair coupling factor (superfamily II helicase)
MRQRLQALTPEARLDVAHGQMPSSQLAEVMQQFAEGACDLLLCTTIVESGMDIPNANTIFIDRADRFGLAELYQLRGRVGRSNQKAYAYMLLPRHAAVDPTARKRIQAIAQYSDLGVGFRLAMRDLEIRGAGNLLGAEQSGHITAVGFGLYCQLLKRSVAGLKGEAAPPVIDVELRLDFMDLSPEHPEAQNSAFIPASYIEDERLRVSLYRKIAEAALPDEVAKLTAELKDRFGPLPPAVQRLLALALLRIEAAARGITLVETREDLLRCVRPGRDALEGGRFPRLKKRLPDARLKEILACIRRL